MFARPIAHGKKLFIIEKKKYEKSVKYVRKQIDILNKTEYNKVTFIKNAGVCRGFALRGIRQTPVKRPFQLNFLKTQVSPSGMASASQADSGGFDSRHLLQLNTLPRP